MILLGVISIICLIGILIQILDIDIKSKWFRFYNYELDLSFVNNYNPLYTKYRINKKNGMVQREWNPYSEDDKSCESWSDFCRIENFISIINKIKKDRIKFKDKLNLLSERNYLEAYNNVIIISGDKNK